MTAMAEAFKNVGIHKPNIQRVWELIRDNPRVTALSICQKLKMQGQSVTPLLSQLFHRGMVERVEDVQRRSGKEYRVQVYTARPHMTEYELLPLKAEYRKVAVKEAVKPVAVSPPTVKVEPVKVEPVKPKFDLDSMPLGEARQLYHQLHDIFGGQHA